MAVLKCVPIHGSAGSPTYSAGDMRNMLAAIIGGTNFEAVAPGIGAVARGHGVLSAPALAVTANGTPNNHVFVAPGLASVRGSQNNDQGPYICPLSSSFDITVPAAHATLDRRDLIVAQVKDAEFAAFTGNVWTPELVQGTPAGSPVDPTVPEDCLVLARLLVRDTTEAGGTIIRTQDITDLRVHARAAGGIIPVATLTAAATIAQPYDVFWSIADSALFMRTPASGWYRLGQDWNAGWTSYTPTLDNTTLGNGTRWGRYLRFGTTVVVEAGFQYGTTSVLSGEIGVSLPFTPVYSGGQLEWIWGARAFRVPEQVYFGGLAVSNAGSGAKCAIFATGGTGGWGSSPAQPFAWNADDGLTMFGVMEVAA